MFCNGYGIYMRELPSVYFITNTKRRINTTVNPFHSGYWKTGTLTNSEDPHEIPQKAAFHLGQQFA